MSGFIIAALIIAVVLAVIIMKQPDEFRVTRSAVIDAPAPVVFDHINNLHKWQTWSPWARMDPDAKGTFAGPDEGIGASIHWEGQKTGVGTMTVIESQPSALVRFRLDFEKPMKATNTADLTLTAKGDKTEVSWSMYGPNNLASKCIGLVMNCEKMVGAQFDQGLQNLNDIVRSAAQR